MNNLLQMLMNSNNPQALAMNLLQQSAPNNPMMLNLLNMVQAKDLSGIEKMARNMCHEKGIDADKAVNSLTQMLSKK